MGLFQIRIFRNLCCALAFCLTWPLAAQTDSADPKDAAGWFQRAHDQMNLRADGAAPFHMKVTFHAFPGIELLKPKETPEIITGDGIYEETWISTRKWGREVTLGNYHAVEVQSGTSRKMQASSDYEPSRILMLLDALLNPVPRQRLSRDLGGDLRWKIEKQTAGELSYVLISATDERMPDHDFNKLAYIFLPGGLLVRSNENNLVISWDHHALFAGRVCPQHLTIQGGGRDLLTADITVEAPGQLDPGAFELPGQEADPGTTLRPFHFYEVKGPNGWAWCSATEISQTAHPYKFFPFREIIDRHGVIREFEVLDSEDMNATTHSATVATLTDCYRHHRLHPATFDANPVEISVIGLK
jgi:hypothetical protein